VGKIGGVGGGKKKRSQVSIMKKEEKKTEEKPTPQKKKKKKKKNPHQKRDWEKMSVVSTRGREGKKKKGGVTGLRFAVAKRESRTCGLSGGDFKKKRRNAPYLVFFGAEKSKCSPAPPAERIRSEEKRKRKTEPPPERKKRGRVDRILAGKGGMLPVRNVIRKREKKKGLYHSTLKKRDRHEGLRSPARRARGGSRNEATTNVA